MKGYILLHKKTNQPLMDYLTSTVLVFPDKEIADTWKYEYDCTESYDTVPLMQIDRSVTMKLRKKIQLQKGESNG